MEAGHPTAFIFIARMAQMIAREQVTPNTGPASPACACSLFSEMVILRGRTAVPGKWPPGKRSTG